MKKKHVVIAGGGTGGHLFPGVALVEEMESLRDDIRFSFVGSPRGIEMRAIPKLGYPLHTVDVKPLKSGGAAGFAKGLFALPKSGVQTWKLYNELSPDLVVAVGGYAAGPFTLMSAMRGCHTALMEQNAVPGMTNKILSKFVDRCFVSFDKTVGLLPAKKCVVAGNPVRSMIQKSAQDFEYKISEGDTFRILVIGGSGGARSLNLGIPKSLKSLPSAIQKKISIVHQCGRNRKDGAEESYKGFEGEFEITEFIDDMMEAYSNCDLLICRAGMSTIAEVAVLGIPALYVPIGTGDGHQIPNAKEVVEAKGGWMVYDVDCGGDKMTDVIENLISDKSQLLDASIAVKKLGRPDAASLIAQTCFDLFL